MNFQLRCSLAVLLVAASLRWGKPVSQRMVAKATKLNPNTVSRLANDVLTDINLNTVGVLCAYFWCRPGELLTLQQPAHAQQLLTAVRRPTCPEAVEPLPVISSISAKLQQASYDHLRQAGLGTATIYRLRVSDPVRVSSETLIALATVFHTTNINEFLSVDLPSTPPPA